MRRARIGFSHGSSALRSQVPAATLEEFAPT